MNAHSLDRILKCGFTGKIFCHTGFHVASLAAIKRRRSVKHEKTCGASPRRHLTQLELDRLMLADRLAEGPARLRVVCGQFQRSFGNADTPCGDVDATELKATRRLVKSLPFDAANQVFGGNTIIFESKLCRIDRFVSKLLQLATDREALFAWVQ